MCGRTGASLGTSMAGLQWAITGYTVAFAALLLSAGAAADRFGAERLFRSGMGAAAAANTEWSLLLSAGAWPSRGSSSR
ncbi:hypothetical protein [Streptomyces sp. NPDC051636]|uniref:hypothetical protein n=1 Tax=Streptomyces sp. NPDC051636 TaxID=3365663 RepID=UPI0037A300ED